jgi:chlorophyllide a reductase subunit X
LSQEGLLQLFKGEAVGRGVVLQPASTEDMCGPTLVDRPSLEIVYDTV